MESIDRVQASFRRSIQRRYDNDQRRMALAVAFLLSLYAPGGTLPTDPRTRLRLKAAIWAQVLRPYYIGYGTEPFNGPVPQSPFAKLVSDGVEGAMRIQVRRSVSLLRRYIKDANIISWFIVPTGGNTHLPAVRQENYQLPFWGYTDPNGYKLNDRILRNAVDARAKLDRMLDYHMAVGSSVGAIGAAVANYMTISGRSTLGALRAPYGEYGSYAPWQMLRGEMLMANGRATVIASELNPLVDRIWWRLSGAHNVIDECDNHASGGPNGDGIYDVGKVPQFPSHPRCVCALVAVADRNTPHMTRMVKAYIESGNDIALRWRGTMDENSLIRSLMTDEYRQANPLTGQNLLGVPAVRLGRAQGAPGQLWSRRP